MKTKKVLRALLIVVILISTFSIDQVTKHIVRQQIEYGERINVIGDYLILTKVENTGAFLGMGDSIPRPLYKVLMILIPLLVIGYTIFYLIKREDLSTWLVIGISLILGGGLGNIYDRILYGSVTDFLYFDFIIFHTGVVNMADIFVTTGFFLVLFGIYFNRKKA